MQDNKAVCAGGNTSGLQVLDVQAGQDGKLVAVASSNGSATLYAATSEQLKLHAALRGARGPVSSALLHSAAGEQESSNPNP